MVKTILNSTKTHATLKDALMHRGKMVLIFAAYFGVFLILVHWAIGGQSEIVAGDDYHNGEIANPVLPGSPADVLNRHLAECWVSEQAPKAELPGAAIVVYPSGKAVYVNNKTPKGFKIVDIAFDEALAAIGYGDKTTDEFDVVALCK
jgi:hypothetical protein